jgi:hypothetical protein
MSERARGAGVTRTRAYAHAHAHAHAHTHAHTDGQRIVGTLLELLLAQPQTHTRRGRNSSGVGSSRWRGGHRGGRAHRTTAPVLIFKFLIRSFSDAISSGRVARGLYGKDGDARNFAVILCHVRARHACSLAGWPREVRWRWRQRSRPLGGVAHGVRALVCSLSAARGGPPHMRK